MNQDPLRQFWRPENNPADTLKPSSVIIWELVQHHSPKSSPIHPSNPHYCLLHLAHGEVVGVLPKGLIDFLQRRWLGGMLGGGLRSMAVRASLSWLCVGWWAHGMGSSDLDLDLLRESCGGTRIRTCAM